MEIADLDARTGVLVKNAGVSGGVLEVVSLRDFRPDHYTAFRHSWRDLSSRIALDASDRVVSLDAAEPERGHATLIGVLRHLDRVTRATGSS